MLYIHLIILISARWSAILLSFFTSQVCRPCNIQLHIHTHTACVEMTVKSMYITLSTTTTIVLWLFVWDYPGEPVPEEHLPTHHPDHHPIFISFFHLPRSIASSLFKLRAWQSFCTTSVHVLFGLPLGLEPSTLYSIHFFTQSLAAEQLEKSHLKMDTSELSNNWCWKMSLFWQSFNVGQ